MGINGTVDECIMNNSIISLEALRKYAASRLKNEKLTYLCNNIEADNTGNFIMSYYREGKLLKIDIRKSIAGAKEYITKKKYDVSILEQIKNHFNYCSKEYRVNMINLFLLYFINHEIIHVKQYDDIEKKPYQNMNQILKVSFDLIISNYYLDLSKYYKYRDYYITEYQADINAGFMILKEIEAKYSNIFGKKELEIFNMYLANEISKRYVLDSNYNNISPIETLKMISNILHTDKGSYITELQNKENEEYNINDLLLGKKISNDVLNQIKDISKGKVKTQNIFNTIYHK